MNHLSIIIPTYKRAKSLKRLLVSIYESELGNLELEILIIDNAQDIQLEKKIRGVIKDDVKILKPVKNLYSGGARQLGLEQAKHDHLLFIDDDNVLEPKCIRQLEEYLNEHPETSIISPVVCFLNNKSIVWSAGGQVSSLGQINYLFNGASIRSMKESRLSDIQFFPNSFMIDRKKMPGVMFDSKELPHNWNETDFCYKAQKFGQLKTVVNAVTYHDIDYAGPLTRISSDKTFDQARSRIVFRKRYMNNAPQWLSFVFIVFPASTVVYFKNFITQNSESRVALIKNYIKGTASGLSYALGSNKHE